MPKKPGTLILFYLLVIYVLVQFAWWSYLLVEQHNEVHRLKKTINLFEYHDPQLITEQGNELEKMLHRKWLMIAGEGLVFFILLLLGIQHVRKAFQKETALAAEQKNFMHSITHELKSPVASVKLQLETLEKIELPKEKQHEIIFNAIQDANRLQHLIENILLAAQIDNKTYSLHKNNINLSMLSENILKKFSAENASHRIVPEISQKIFCKVDEVAWHSILFNLVENAIKYSPAGSAITVQLAVKGEKIILSVGDSGNGITDEEKKNIFKKFYRTGNEETRSTKGTGLGLYIVKYLVEKHNGTITVKNNSPTGSIFEVTLNK